MKKLLPALLVMLFALTACNTATAMPTITPSATPEPTQTFTPLPSATATATETPTALPPTGTPTPDGFPIPEGEPSSDWQGLPVMPGAIAGEGDKDGYTFTTDASVEEIQAYYEKAMGKLGWSLLANGLADNGSLLMIFTESKGGIASIAVFEQDGVFFVFLTM